MGQLRQQNVQTKNLNRIFRAENTLSDSEKIKEFGKDKKGKITLLKM